MITSLYKRIVVDFAATTIAVLMAGATAATAGAYFHFDKKYENEAGMRADSSVEVFASLARFGDIRYTKFVLGSLKDSIGLLEFRVFTPDGEEVQASSRAVTGVDMQLIRSIKDYSQDAEPATRMRVDGALMNYYPVRLANGEDYIAVVKIRMATFPWGFLFTTIAVIVLLAVGSYLLVAKRSHFLSDKIDEFSRVLREGKHGVPHAPFVELEPVVEAVSAYVAEAKAHERHAAISQTTQMIAHDMRKPFSMLKLGLGMLRDSKDFESIQEVVAILTPELDKAVYHADGLIADVMEFGKDPKGMARSSLDARVLIDAIAAETKRIHQVDDGRIDLKCSHTMPISGNSVKIYRLLSNVLVNAVQAAGKGGRIWILTRDSGDFVEFCVGNSGSYIDSEQAARVFDAFYTSGKESGTGLGLAIAQKIAREHGGEIWCRSSRDGDFPEGKVEFFFSVPVACS